MLVADGHKVSIITSAYDLNTTEILAGIQPNTWNDIAGQQVYYMQKNEHGIKIIRTLIENCAPEFIYANGMFSLQFAIIPLMLWRLNFRSANFIWAPRGMLQVGALKTKAFKKFFFLNLIKLARLRKGVIWHATDETERRDIIIQFGQNANVTILPNIPKSPLERVASINKSVGELRLVYLSLISQKKNLHLALQWLNEMEVPVVFDIYGPVKDASYWQLCQSLIQKQPGNISVSYKGDVQPEDVQSVFSKYHALLLPTAGENFGHAIYECLSVGRPVIIGTETPWKHLESQRAGFDIPLGDDTAFKEAIMLLHRMDSDEYNQWCENALGVAHKYWNGNDFVFLYSSLFN